MFIRLVASVLVALLSPVCIAQQPPGATVPLSQVQLDQSRLRVHFIDIGPGWPCLSRRRAACITLLMEESGD